MGGRRVDRGRCEKEGAKKAEDGEVGGGGGGEGWGGREGRKEGGE